MINGTHTFSSYDAAGDYVRDRASEFGSFTYSELRKIEDKTIRVASLVPPVFVVYDRELLPVIEQVADQ